MFWVVVALSLTTTPATVLFVYPAAEAVTLYVPVGMPAN